MTRKEQIEARDAMRSRLVSSVPGLSCWTVYEPQHPDTDLWINCLVAAYNADPTDMIKDGAFAPYNKHRIVAERMYDRLIATAGQAPGAVDLVASSRPPAIARPSSHRTTQNGAIVTLHPTQQCEF